VSLYYADTSTVIKLLAEETHSKAFAAFYDGHGGAEWVSSALLRIEVTQAVARGMQTAGSGPLTRTISRPRASSRRTGCPRHLR